jgi:Zn-dependent protease
MLPIFAATILCLTTLYALRGGLVGERGFLTIAGFDANGAMLGIAAVGAAVWFYGPMFGAALILSVMVHEFGHVAAFRACGHRDARFRLIPLLGGVAISNQIPASQEKDFFITLMGPGICIAPMVLASVIIQYDFVYMHYNVMYPLSSTIIEFLSIFAVVTGALNFFNLLPFWPLDGGRCLSILCNTFWPGGTRQMMFAMSGALIALAIYSQSFILVAFAVLGAQGLFRAEQIARFQRPMAPTRATLAAAAYLTTLATFGVTGWPILSGFF